MSLFQISAFADEYSPDINEQIKGLLNTNIKMIEPRGVFGKNISSLDEGEAEELAKLLSDADIKISAIGSPLGKFKLEDREAHLKAVRNTVKVAKILGADRIRGFSYFMSAEEAKGMRDRVLSSLDEVINIVSKEGLLYCHENEKGIYGSDLETVKDISDHFKGGIGIVFDPANFVQCGQNVKEAFDELYGDITYLHIKDALPDGTIAAAGEGVADIPYILHRFNRDKRSVTLTLEPHLRVFAGLEALETGEKTKIVNTFKTSQEAFIYAAERLHNLILSIK